MIYSVNFYYVDFLLWKNKTRFYFLLALLTLL